MKVRFLFLLLASLLVGLLAISHQSFWIDEPFTARYAIQPDLAGWWGALKVSAGPDIQMLVYTLYLWCWEKLFGSSEFALRAANIPWFLLAQASFWFGLRRWPRLKWAAVVFQAFNPFLWRYLDELRPYAMEYAGAAAVMSCLAWLAGEEEIRAGWLFAFGTSIFILCSSSSLGIPWAGSAVLAFACLAWGEKRIVWNWASIVSCLAPGFALTSLAGYYIWTIPHGLGGISSVGQPFEVFCFALYELVGFLGLGPGRIAISDALTPRIFLPYLSILAPAALLLAGMLVFALRSFWRQANPRLKWAACVYLIPPIFLLATLTLLQNWHATGRHFTPASAALVLFVALATATAWREKSQWKMAWMAAFCLIWIVSCLETRFASRHLRDDYRDAAKVAQAALAKQERVWWAASDVAGMYYGVPLSTSLQSKEEALVIWQPRKTDLQRILTPDCVIFSKPRLFDPNNAVTEYLRDRHYHRVSTLPAFVIWER